MKPVIWSLTPFAVLPREAEFTHVREAEPGRNVAEGVEVTFVEPLVHHGALSPVHQRRARDAVLKVVSEL